MIAGWLALTLSAEERRSPIAARKQLQRRSSWKLVDGDLKAAIEQFKMIAQNSRPDVAAEALAHLAACYEKLGGGAKHARPTSASCREHPNPEQWLRRLLGPWLHAHARRYGCRGGGRSTALTAAQVWTGPG